MRWAAELIESAGVPIKQIAWKVGYRDQFYFSRLFKFVYSISPSEYRAQKKSVIMNGSREWLVVQTPSQAPDVRGHNSTSARTMPR
jgi:AraC-like DNA-binding protein